MNNGFYKNRRLKSFLFFAVCLLVSIAPHIFYFKNFLYLTFTISFFIANSAAYSIKNVVPFKISRNNY